MVKALRSVIAAAKHKLCTEQRAVHILHYSTRHIAIIIAKVAASLTVVLDAMQNNLMNECNALQLPQQAPCSMRVVVTKQLSTKNRSEATWKCIALAACATPMITAVQALSTLAAIVSALFTCENVRRPVRPSSPVNVQLAFAMVASFARAVQIKVANGRETRNKCNTKRSAVNDTQAISNSSCTAKTTPYGY
eukprot:14194-Heterococcus_DN1.PRE.3